MKTNQPIILDDDAHTPPTLTDRPESGACFFSPTATQPEPARTPLRTELLTQKPAPVPTLWPRFQLRGHHCRVQHDGLHHQHSYQWHCVILCRHVPIMSLGQTRLSLCKTKHQKWQHFETRGRACQAPGHSGSDLKATVVPKRASREMGSS